MIIIKDPIVIMKCRMTSRTLFLGTFNKDGFGVVIRNLSEADLNVTYRCIYGFNLSIPEYLLYDHY
jgi:hypothetical protein